MTLVHDGKTGTGEKELELLLTLCRVFLYDREQDKDRIRELTHTGIAWRIFIRLVNYHRLLPVIYPLLNLLVDFPAALRSRLDKRFEAHKNNSLDKAAETARLARLFRSQGIDALCLKGVPLTLRLYDNLFDRHQGDIDFLGRWEDIEKVHFLLLDQGYNLLSPSRQEIFSSPRAKKVFSKANVHVNYLHPEHKMRVEFHFRLFKNPYYFPYDAHDFFQRKRTVSYHRAAIDIPPLPDEDLYLFAHGANHQWFRLKWLLDIAMLCRDKETQWQPLLEKALQFGLERVVTQGLHLSRHLFASPVPAVWENPRFNPPGLSPLVRGALAEVEQSRHEARGEKRSKLPRFGRKTYLTKLKKGLRYKLYHWRELVFLDANRSVLKLPAVLFPLYYILNPFLWFYRKFVMSPKAGVKQP